MALPDAESLGDLELIPADDTALTPEEELEAAAQSALAPEYPEAPVEEPEPLGRSSVFDHSRGRFVRRGAAPAQVTGRAALEQWCLNAVYSARFGHAVLLR